MKTGMPTAEVPSTAKRTAGPIPRTSVIVIQKTWRDVEDSVPIEVKRTPKKKEKEKEKEKKRETRGYSFVPYNYFLMISQRQTDL